MPRSSKSTPPPVTDTYVHFYSEMERVDSFFKLIFSLSEHVDFIRIGSARIKHKYEDDLEETDLEQRLEEVKSTGAKRAVMSYSRLILELMTCRHIDNYLCYISQILGDIFRTKPETLRSNEQVRLDFVLNHESMSDLIDDIAEHQVNKLSYQGMTELAVYLKDKIGLETFQDEGNMASVIQAIEMRNLIVHARGIVNKLFLRKTGNRTVGVGEIVPLDPDIGMAMIENMHVSVRTIDEQAIRKFGVPSAKVAIRKRPSNPKGRKTRNAKQARPRLSRTKKT